MKSRPLARLFLFVALGMFLLALLSAWADDWATPKAGPFWGTVPTLTPSATRPLPSATRPPATTVPSPTPETPPPSPLPSSTPQPTAPLGTPLTSATPAMSPTPPPVGSPSPTSPRATPSPEAWPSPTLSSPATPLSAPTPTPTPERLLLVPGRSHTVWSPAGDVRVEVPTGAVGGEVNLVLIPQRRDEVPAGAPGQLVLGHAFALAAADGRGRPLARLERAFTISVFCGAEDLRRGGGDPRNLYLAYWDVALGSWQALPTEREGWEKAVALSTGSANLGLFAVLSTVPTEVPPTGEECLRGGDFALAAVVGREA